MVIELGHRREEEPSSKNAVLERVDVLKYIKCHMKNILKR